MTRHERLPEVFETLALAVCLLGSITILSPPAGATFHEDAPIVLEKTGDVGDSLAFAVRSDDEPTTYQGNEFIVTAWANYPYQRSIASMGILELKRDSDGEFAALRGGVGTAFQGEDRLHVEPIGHLPDATEPAEVHPPSVLPDDDTIGGIGERRFMEPGEWRYFVVWASGSETSTIRIQGEGFELVELIEGEAHAFGKSELVDGDGIHARQGIELPPTTSKGKGYVGAGASAVRDSGVTLEPGSPLLGVFTEFHERDVCTWVPLSGCLSAGPAANEGVSQVRPGGFANISIDTPHDGHAWNAANSYWLKPPHAGGYDGTKPGLYHFRVDDLVDVSGPSYREPFGGTGVRLDGEQPVLSLGEIDYMRLEEIEER